MSLAPTPCPPLGGVPPRLRLICSFVVVVLFCFVFLFCEQQRLRKINGSKILSRITKQSYRFGKERLEKGRGRIAENSELEQKRGQQARMQHLGSFFSP